MHNLRIVSKDVGIECNRVRDQVLSAHRLQRYHADAVAWIGALEQVRVSDHTQVDDGTIVHTDLVGIVRNRDVCGVELYDVEWLSSAVQVELAGRFPKGYVLHD